MGVAVCLLLWPAQPALGRAMRRLDSRWLRILALGVLLAGLWNAGWYGLRHLGDFWGRAALISGAMMVAASLVAMARPNARAGSAQRTGTAQPHALGLATWALVLGLAACFCLYAVALVRLNLGLSVPGF
jgi:hypothetical protein